MPFIVTFLGILIIFALWGIGDSLSHIVIQLTNIANKMRSGR
jgi:hypothetical protein